MREGIKTLTDQHVNEIEEYIEEGTVADYLIEEAKSLECGYYFYLSEDEKDNYEHDYEVQIQYEREIKKWITENYSFNG